jgi:GT2 family glycosyltransferase
MLASEFSRFPFVWIVVLHWQGNEATKACLVSLKTLNYPNYKVLLLDNGSPDNGGASIASGFPEIQYMRIANNLGFAGGANFGVKHCFSSDNNWGNSCDWVWLLNNDTTVHADSLNLLVKASLANKKAGVLAASQTKGLIDFFKAKTYEKTILPDEDNKIIICDWLAGNNLLFNKVAFEEINGFDERYFLYFEDVDLCLRLRMAGWQCLAITGSHVNHLGSASTQGDLSIWRSYYHTRNRLLFFSKHLKYVRLLIAFFFIHAHILRHLITLPWRGKSKQRQLKAELLGLIDFYRGNFGKANCLDW